MPLEFRVRWEREDRQPTYRIFQSWSAACRKMTAVAALNDVKGEFSKYEDMPDLVGPPEMQVREVSEWRRHDYQPGAQDCHRESMRDHCRWQEPVQPQQEEDGIAF
jgi:hypothetical protein